MSIVCRNKFTNIKMNRFGNPLPTLNNTFCKHDKNDNKYGVHTAVASIICQRIRYRSSCIDNKK